MPSQLLSSDLWPPGPGVSHVLLLFLGMKELEEKATESPNLQRDAPEFTATSKES